MLAQSFYLYLSRVSVITDLYFLVLANSLIFECNPYIKTPVFLSVFFFFSKPYNIAFWDVLPFSFFFPFLKTWLILKARSLQFILQTGSCRIVSSNNLCSSFSWSLVSLFNICLNVSNKVSTVSEIYITVLLNPYFQLDIPVYIITFTKVLSCTNS